MEFRPSLEIENRVQYLNILLNSFGEEDFQGFTLNLLRSNFGYYFANNASGADLVMVDTDDTQWTTDNARDMPQAPHR